MFNRKESNFNTKLDFRSYLQLLGHCFPSNSHLAATQLKNALLFSGTIDYSYIIYYQTLVLFDRNQHSI